MRALYVIFIGPFMLVGTVFWLAVQGFMAGKIVATDITMSMKTR